MQSTMEKSAKISIAKAIVRLTFHIDIRTEVFCRLCSVHTMGCVLVNTHISFLLALNLC